VGHNWKAMLNKQKDHRSDRWSQRRAEEQISDSPDAQTAARCQAHQEAAYRIRRN